MIPLTSGELAKMRATNEDALPETGTVQRPSTTRDAMGGSDETFVTVATVAMRIDPFARIAGTEEVREGNRITSIGPWIITMPRDTDVRVMDRIVVAGRTFAVQQVGDRSWELSLRVFCSEVK